jgi:hypothetical protein
LTLHLNFSLPSHIPHKAMARAEADLTSVERALVVDVGGGTFDVSVSWLNVLQAARKVVPDNLLLI